MSKSGDGRILIFLQRCNETEDKWALSAALCNGVLCPFRLHGKHVIIANIYLDVLGLIIAPELLEYQLHVIYQQDEVPDHSHTFVSENKFTDELEGIHQNNDLQMVFI